MTDTKKSSNALSFKCNWRLGLNLRFGKNDRIGYLLSLSGFGGLNLQKDIEAINPFSGAGQTVVSGSAIPCVGLLELFHFDGGEGDPLRLKAYLSKANAANVRAKLARPLSTTGLKLAWYIIDFDSDAKVWYEASFIRSPTQAEANLDGTGGDLQIFVDNEPTSLADHLDIGVFGLEIQVVPADGKSATLEFATGPRTRLVKRWG